jgi:catechol 2,3-dioxygenase-like lactoylglutathione lyase family enzyme
MAELWISYFGIRVTNLERSEEFYTRLFDLVELKRVRYDGGAYILFKDRRSGQRFELNWYAPGSPYDTPYTPGDGWDHIGVRVRSVPEQLERLEKLGIEAATRELHGDPTTGLHHPSDEDLWVEDNGHRVAYIKDPDGNFIELYDHPEESWDGPIPDLY